MFTEWLEAVQGKLTERVATKKPIGTVHNETEEFLVGHKRVKQNKKSTVAVSVAQVVEHCPSKTAPVFRFQALSTVM